MKREIKLSDRDKVLKKYFTLAVIQERYKQEDFHLFCKHAKGVSEQEMQEEFAEPNAEYHE